jgi:hypothetical protein
VYDDAALRQTQVVAIAASDERTLTRSLHDEIIAVLSPEQRVRLDMLFSGRIVE